MANSLLESLAVPYELYPGVKLWMMPFSTLETGAVIAKLRELNGGDFDRWDNSFGLIEGYLVRFEIKGRISPKAKVWKLYLDARESCPELAQRRDLFRSFGAYHLITDAQRAYTATQDTTYDNTEDVPVKPEDDADPS